jgi:hypothetical protein
MAERDFRWRPDDLPPHYPPRNGQYANTPAGHQQLRDDLARGGHDPGDADVWPVPASDLTDTARLELRRCATAFENTARRLREIVGNE